MPVFKKKKESERKRCYAELARLERELETKSQEVQGFVGSIENEQQRFEALAQEFGGQQTELDLVKGRLKDEEERSSALEKELEEQTKSTEALKVSHTKVENSWKEILANSKKELEKLEETRLKERKEAESLKRLTDWRLKRLEEARNRGQSLTTELLQKTEETEELKGSITMLELSWEQRLANCEKRFASNLEIQRLEHRKELETQMLDISSCKIKIKKLVNALKAQKASFKELEAKANNESRMDKEAWKRLEQEWIATKGRLLVEEKKFRDSMNETRSLYPKIKNLKEILKNSEEDNQDLKAVLEKYKTELENRKAELAKAKAEQEKGKAELDKVKAELEKFKADVDYRNVSLNLREINVKLKASRISLSYELEDQLCVARNKIALLEAALNLAGIQKNAAERRGTRSQKAEDVIRQELSTKNNKVIELEIILAQERMTHQAELKRRESCRLLHENKKDQARPSLYENRVAELTNRIRQANDKLSSVYTEYYDSLSRENDQRAVIEENARELKQYKKVQRLLEFELDIVLKRGHDKEDSPEQITDQTGERNKSSTALYQEELKAQEEAVTVVTYRVHSQ